MPKSRLHIIREYSRILDRWLDESTEEGQARWEPRLREYEATHPWLLDRQSNALA